MVTRMHMMSTELQQHVHAEYAAHHPSLKFLCLVTDQVPLKILRKEFVADFYHHVS